MTDWNEEVSRELENRLKGIHAPSDSSTPIGYSDVLHQSWRTLQVWLVKTNVHKPIAGILSTRYILITVQNSRFLYFANSPGEYLSSGGVVMVRFIMYSAGT